MASPQSDIITTVTKVRQESSSDETTISNTKQKLTVPRRIMEEEVWLSGSELKTDNSSSEEDRPVDAQDRVKKGAKKKTKTFSQSERSRKQILRQNREELTTEIVETNKEVSSTTVADTNRSELSPRFDTTLDALDKMLSKCEGNSNHFMKISCNKADDEKSQLQKVKLLEERIVRAEKVYMDARKETDRLVAQMENMLNSVSGLEGPDWNFFTDITKKWVRCFSGGNSKSSLLQKQSDSSYIENEIQNIEENQLRKSRHRSMRNKDKNKKLIKIRKGMNCSIVLKNIKQSSRTRFFQDVKPPTLNNYESSRLNAILNSNDEIYSVDNDYIGYKLQPQELEKLASISNRLRLTWRKDSDNAENYSGLNQASETTVRTNDRLKREDSSGSFAMDPQYACLTDSEKQRIFNASRSNLSLSDSIDGYGSCDEAPSEFASSTNLDIQDCFKY